MVTRDKIVVIARSYLGSPFHHQGRVKDGIDCAGLIFVIGKEIGSPVEDCVYKRKPTRGIIMGQLGKSLDRIDIESALYGDILVFWVYKKGYDQHLAIKSDKGMIHTYADIGFVAENGLNDFWSKRIMAAFRYKGVD